MLFFRYHAPQTKRPVGPWSRDTSSARAQPYEEEYRGWQVEITSCRVGVTVTRTQYRVVLRDTELGYEHSLTGFPSQAAALAAARRWIEGRQRRHQVVARQRRAQHHRRRNRDASSS
jgi:hypothetical protein